MLRMSFVAVSREFVYPSSAATAVFMEAMDFSKRCFDSGESLSSMILSMPFFPKTTGTPIE